MRGMSKYSSVQAVGGPLLHRTRIGIGEDGGPAVLADVLGIVADQPVALARHTMLDLAGGGDLEAFLHAALGLQLGHFRLLYSGTRSSQPWQPFWPDRQMNHVSVKRAPLGPS